MPTNPRPDPDDPRTIPDEAFLDAVRELAAAGRTDLADGGVPVCAVATRLGINERVARTRLTALAEDDDSRLVACRGLSPEGFRPRVSYRLTSDAPSPP